MSDASSQKKKSNKGLIAIIILLLLGVGGLSYLLVQKDNEVKDVSSELALIKTSLEQSIKQVQGLNSTNDSMNTYIIEREARLQGMLDSVNNVAKVSEQHLRRWRSNAINAGLEVDRLSAVVDSMAKAYTILKLDHDSLAIDLEVEKIRTEELTSQTRELKNEVAVGSQLKLTSINAGAYKVYSSGTEDETQRARRAERVKACLTIGANSIAEKGLRNVYMRVLTPDLKIIAAQNVDDNRFFVKGNEMVFTASKNVWYENEDVNVCLSYDKEEWVSGTYTVEIYIEDNKVQEARFVLD